MISYGNECKIQRTQTTKQTEYDFPLKWILIPVIILILIIIIIGIIGIIF